MVQRKSAGVHCNIYIIYAAKNQKKRIEWIRKGSSYTISASPKLFLIKKASKQICIQKVT